MNRVKKIQAHPETIWRHVPTRENPRTGDRQPVVVERAAVASRETGVATRSFNERFSGVNGGG